jgi:hypothetical protein
MFMTQMIFNVNSGGRSAGDRKLAVVNTDLQASHFGGLSAESNGKLYRAGGHVLTMLN